MNAAKKKPSNTSRAAARPLPSKPKAVPWKMPAHLEPFRELICNTGGNTIEDLMARSRDPDCNVIINAPLALICQSVESQITLLNRLHGAGLLKPAAASRTRRAA